MIQVWLTSNDFVADWVSHSYRLDIAFNERTIPLWTQMRLLFGP